MSDNPYQPPEARLLVVGSSDRELLTGSLNFKQFIRLKKIYRRSVRVNVFTGFVLFAAALLLYPSVMFGDEGSSRLAAAGAGGLYLFTGVALARRVGYGRYLGLLAGLSFTVVVPWGTVVGVIGLWTLIPAASIFGRERMMHDEIKRAYRARLSKAKEAFAKETKKR